MQIMKMNSSFVANLAFYLLYQIYIVWFMKVMQQ